MSKRFAGKVVAITGAASGVGAATAHRFAEEGASLVLADLNEGQGQDLTAQLAKTGAAAHFVRRRDRPAEL